MKLLLQRGVIPLLVLVLSAPDLLAAQSASTAVETQLRTALPHARELLERGLGVVSPQLHLQLVLNCLEGPKGRHFNAAVGDPCQGQGNGILPDLKAAVAAKEKGAGAALEYATIACNQALEAVVLTDQGEVERRAKLIASYLQRALDALH